MTNLPPLLGSLAWEDEGGEPTVVAAAFGFVPNQGDGWTYTLETLHRAFEPLVLAAGAADDGEVPLRRQAVFDLYAAIAGRLGTRTGDMHRAFAIDTDDPTFARAPITAADLAAWGQGVQTQARTALAALRRGLEQIGPSERVWAEAVLAAEADFVGRIEDLIAARVAAAKTRLHGDVHLG